MDQLTVDLSPSQGKFHSSEAKFRSMIGGRGSGKTFSLCLEAVRTSLENPGTQGAIVASTFRSIDDFILPTITDELWAALGIENGWDRFIESFNRQTKIATFKSEYGGSRIYFRSADEPKELRGMNLGWFGIDEACKLNKLDTWNILLGVLRHPKGPLKGWVTTTPRGFDWVWSTFARKKRRDYEWFQCSTEENVHLPKEYVESLKDAYKGKFLKQEVFGEFVAYEGMVYPMVSQETHHLPAPESDSPEPTYKYSLSGVDWGWTDPTVVLVGAVGTDGFIHLVEEFYESKSSKEKINDTAVGFRDKWGVLTFWCDPSRPDSIYDLKTVGLDARRAKNELDYGIAEVYNRLDSGMIKIDYNKCPHTVEEFGMYRYDEDDSGKILKTVPIDADNHCMDALRYLIYSHRKRTSRQSSMRSAYR